MKTNKGSALWEALPVTALLLVLVTVIFLVCYLFFARAFILYHVEQSLYCAVVGRPPRICQEHFARKLREFLPWGSLQRVHLACDPKGSEMTGLWRLGSYRLPIRHRLEPEIARKKASSWSAWSR